MSQSVQQQVQIDQYLAKQTPPPGNDLKVDAQYGSIRLVTAIGRFAYLNVDRPKQVKQPDGSMGAPQFSGTLLLAPAACGEIYAAIVAVGANRFPSEQRPDPRNPNAMITMSADAQDPNLNLFFLPPRQGGLHYPLRQGDENYMRDPKRYEQWRGLFFINASILAASANGQSQRPICKDENGRDCDPSRFYSGCYGRMQLTFFAFPKPGSPGRGTRGVGVTLNALQFARHGEKLGSFDASKAAEQAFNNAGTIEPDPASQQTGYGPNSATPGSVPGFAAPPQGQPIPPNANPGFAQPGFAGARPPGI